MSEQLLMVFDGTAAERFEQFHQQNPIVYSTLVKVAREWVNRHGQRKLGIRMLWEVSRWNLIQATNNVDYKLNDHYTAYYSRLIAAQEPDLADVFELRRSPADAWLPHYLDSRAAS